MAFYVLKKNKTAVSIITILIYTLFLYSVWLLFAFFPHSDLRQHVEVLSVCMCFRFSLSSLSFCAVYIKRRIIMCAQYVVSFGFASTFGLSFVYFIRLFFSVNFDQSDDLVGAFVLNLIIINTTSKHIHQIHFMWLHFCSVFSSLPLPLAAHYGQDERTICNGLWCWTIDT